MEVSLAVEEDAGSVPFDIHSQHPDKCQLSGFTTMSNVLWLQVRSCLLFSAVAWAAMLIGSCSADCDQLALTERTSGEHHRLNPPLFATLPTAALFDDDVLADNVFAIRQVAKSMSGEARYDFLRTWVLPSVNHAGFRLSAKLTPADPAPPLIDDHPFDLQRLQTGAQLRQSRVHTGGNLVSPVFDLLRTAAELDRLDELYAAVSNFDVVGEVQVRGRLSMLTMIEIAREGEGAAEESDQLFNRLLTGAFPQLSDRMPETLLVWWMVEQGQLLPDALRFLIHIRDNQIRKQHCDGPGEWNRMYEHLIGRIAHMRQAGREQMQFWNSQPNLQTWHTVTRKQAWADGSGIPSAHWSLSDRTVENLASHDEEFLLFGIPLRGNFMLECECTGFGYMDCHPMFTGKWLAPVYHHETVSVGNLREMQPDIVLNPKLSRVDHWLRYRISLQDHICRRFINGRLIDTEELAENHDPWLAIRSPNYGEGHVRNVRITGDPVIPEYVELSELHNTASRQASTTIPGQAWPISQLHGWMSWDEDPNHPEKRTWQLESTPADPDSTDTAVATEIAATDVAVSGSTVIVGQFRPELSGTVAEQLLRYHWPIVWDSEISYEFYYRQGEMLVHPAIGRRAFLLGEQGVQTHWVTADIWDITNLEPGNATEDGNRVSARPGPLPFKVNSWNRLTFSLNGDAFALSLNETPIFAGDLEPTNDRTFGLFYFCDQTEARVRNIVLKGNWPRSLPLLSEQELRGIQTDVLDRERQTLAESFEFDFRNATQQEFDSTFHCVNDFRLASTFRLQPDGLHLKVEAAAQSHAMAYLTPTLLITGDFDVIAEFESLELNVSENGSSAIYLGPRIQDPSHQTYFVFRGVVQHPDTPLRQITQVEFVENGPKGFKYSYPAILAEESTAGRLRMTRRGKTYTFLIAPPESDNFRQLYSREISAAPLLPGNLMLRSSCYSSASTGSAVSVIWKNISIRADSLSASASGRMTN